MRLRGMADHMAHPMFTRFGMHAPRTTLSADTHSVSADTHSAGAGGSLPWDLFTSRVEDHDWSDSEEDAPSAARPPKPYVRRVIASSTGRPTTYYEHRSNGAPATRRPGRQLNNAFDPLFVSPTTTGLVKTSIRPVPIPFAYLRSTDSSDDDFDEERPRKSATPKVRRHLNAVSMWRPTKSPVLASSR